MKKNEVKVGGFYTAKVSDKLVTVRIDSAHSRTGWNATNTRTGKRIHIKSAQRLRSVAGRQPDDGAKVDMVVVIPGPCSHCKGKGKFPYCEFCKRVFKRPVADEAGDAGSAADQDETQEQEIEMAKTKAAPKGKTKTKTTPKAAKAKAKPKRISALDAAAQVLKETNKPMRATELIEAMAERNLWKSPGGATPHATLYAAMMREARDKGGTSRFAKVDRGMFAHNG